MPKQRSNQESADYEVGYRRPPKQYQFKAGQVANPEGTNRTPARSPDFKASVERELAKTIRVKQGKRWLTLTQEAAGTSVLVRQYVEGDSRARRDLIHLCKEYGVNLSTRDALQGALADALSAEDEALLADFVRRHGGHYPLGADASAGVPAKDQKLLGPPADDQKLLTSPHSTPTKTEENAND